MNDFYYLKFVEVCFMDKIWSTIMNGPNELEKNVCPAVGG